MCPYCVPATPCESSHSPSKKSTIVHFHRRESRSIETQKLTRNPGDLAPTPSPTPRPGGIRLRNSRPETRSVCLETEAVFPSLPSSAGRRCDQGRPGRLQTETRTQERGGGEQVSPRGAAHRTLHCSRSPTAVQPRSLAIHTVAVTQAKYTINCSESCAFFQPLLSP